MWEVFTCGKMPYGRLKNTEVVERVQRGIILERPKACAKEIYEVSLIRNCVFSCKTFSYRCRHICVCSLGYEKMLGTSSRRSTKFP